MLDVRIAGYDEIQRLRDTWNDLVFRMPFPNVFLTWEWVVTWWELFASEDRRLVVLLACANGQPKGILPLYGERAFLRNHWQSGTILTFCSALDLYPDHLDIIAATSDAAECARSFAGFLASPECRWDALHVPMVTSESAIVAAVEGGAANERGFSFDFEPVSIARYVGIDGPYDTFLARLDAKKRYNLRSRAKKLFVEHDARIEAIQDDDVEALGRLFALHRLRAARKGIVSSLADPRVLQFHQTLARRISPKGWISMRELKCGTETIASSYNFDFAGRIFSYQKGLDPAWERLGPGTVLLAELIREAYAAGRIEYNFLQGDEPYKADWSREYRTLFNFTLYNSSALGRLSRTSHRLKRALRRDIAKATPSRSGASLDVEIGGPAQLQEWRAEWDALARAMRYPTIFVSWEWIRTWWEHFGIGRQLHLVAVRRDGRLRAILPLYAETQLAGRHGRVGRVMEFAGASDLFPDPLDIIGASEDAQPCLAAALDCLIRDFPMWDVAHFRFADEQSELLRGLATAGYSGPMTETTRAPYIPIRGSYDTYFGGLSGNERSKIRRVRRRLMQEQGFAYCDLGVGNRNEALAALFELHARRAAVKNIRSSFAQARVARFHEDLLSRLDRGQYWLRGLRRDGDLIAVFYGFVHGTSISYYQLGFDPDWAEYSPGTVLLQETIREAFEQGFSEYNLLQGDEEFKLRWTPHFRRLFSVDVFRPTMLGRVSRWATIARHGLKEIGLAVTGR